MNQRSPHYGPECASPHFLSTVEDYPLYVPLHDFPMNPLYLLDLPRREARAEYKRVNEMKSERLGLIKTILIRNSIEPRITDKTKDDLEVFIKRNVFSNEYRSNLPNAGNVLDALWFSLAFDLGLLLEEHVLNKYPHLYIDLNTYVPKRRVGRHQRIITGFKNEPYRYYGIDYPSIMVMRVTGVMTGERRRIDFDEILDIADKYA